MRKTTRRPRREHRVRRANAPLALPPGSLVADPKAGQTTIKLIVHGADTFVERDCAGPEDIRPYLDKGNTVWVDVDGLGDVDLVRAVGELFHLHPLSLEDVVNSHQRPKVEAFENYVFIVTQMVRLIEQLESEQLSIFLGKDFVVTFQESAPVGCLDPVRERLRSASKKSIPVTADYLAYSLLDTVVDHVFPVLEEFGERLERLEGVILENPGPPTLASTFRIKHSLLALRRAAWPLREAVNALIRDPNDLIGENTRIHLRDCYDHIMRVIDMVETYREICSDLMDLYLSNINNRMNEIMKVLTIIATIFIPLTFISGIYGMNFNTQKSPWNLPELEWYYGYPYALGLMSLCALGLLWYFKRKGWFSADAEPYTHRFDEEQGN